MAKFTARRSRGLFAKSGWEVLRCAPKVRRFLRTKKRLRLMPNSVSSPGTDAFGTIPMSVSFRRSRARVASRELPMVQTIWSGFATRPTFLHGWRALFQCGFRTATALRPRVHSRR